MSMSLDEVYENLCTKDSRSPYFYIYDEDEVIVARDNCACDNCFYGRDKLALTILELMGIELKCTQTRQ